jgi:hypothetical protein
MATLSEIEAIEEAHQAAQARLGIIGAYLAMADWTTVSATAATETSAGWLARCLRMIFGIRRYSRRLSQSHYQLARALETGRTLGLPEYSSDPAAITIDGLRKQYTDLLLEIATIDTEAPADAEGRWLHARLLDELAAADANRRKIRLDASGLDPHIQNLLDAAGDGDASVEVDEFDWLDDMTEQEVEDAFAKLLVKNAVAIQSDAAATVRQNEDMTPAEALDAISESHASAGSMGAGKVDKYGISAGRDAINDAIQHDGRVEMFARKCGPNPCYFCAMLASRGFVYKKSTGSTTNRDTTVAGNYVGGDIRKFHDNCHCTLISRWELQSKLPEQNQFYKDLWLDVTKGLGGKAAMSKWRSEIYARQRDRLNAMRASAKQSTP